MKKYHSSPEPLEARIAPATFLVTSTADSGVGSFRQAILDANAAPGADVINFGFATGSGPVIAPISALPAISGDLVIDAALVAGGSPEVVLDGLSAGASSVGITISGSNVTLSGLVICNFGSHGVLVNGSTNTIVKNNIGTDATGTADVGNGGDGIRVASGSGNTIGSASAGNLISGNTGSGVHLALGSTGATVLGNRIGVDSSGTVAIPNLNGVLIDGDSGGNNVGGPATGEGNLISGNTDYGIKTNSTVNGSTSAPSQFIRGNYIGTGAGGLGDVGNGKSGVFLASSIGVRVGGTATGEGNIISGNNQYGVEINSGSRHQLYGNWIGIDATGNAAVGNTLSGVRVDGSNLNVIGSQVATARNVISGNLQSGIHLVAGGDSTTIIGNFIGTNAAGSAPLGNTLDGVRIQFAKETTVGGAGTNAGNVISGNGGDGIFVQGTSTTFVATIKQNNIGTDAAGTAAVANGGNGIQFSNVTGTATIGGSGSGSGNIIAGNGLSGILIGTADATTIQGNTIGKSGIANARGVLINASTGGGITVGGISAGQGNTVAFNTGAGVVVAGTANASIRGNILRDNGGIGIDLGNNGATANDATDSDSGGNGLLNFPVLTSVVATGGGTVVSGSYSGSSLPNTALTIDFYSNSATGQAETYLGSTNVTTDATGVGLFSASLSAVPAGRTVSATTNITASPAQTSEISSRVAQVPGITVSDVSAAEGQAGTTNFIFTVTLGASAASNVTVDFATADDTATAGSDFIANSGTLTFTPGQTSKTVTVAVNGDATFETTERFFVNLTNAVGATIVDSQGIGTITNDDAQTEISINDVSISEGNSGTTNLTFTLSMASASASPVSVDFATANGTAVAGSDYVAASGTVTFAAGETSKTVVVPILGDTVVEAAETLVVNLTNAVGATISDAQGTGTIVNDDLPTLAINDATLGEGNSGTAQLVFTVTLSEPFQSTVTVAYSTANGTATAGVDFTAASGTLTFAAGETSKTVSVPLFGDSVVEASETFFVNLSAPTNATLLDGQGVGSITNDDATAISVGDASLVEGNAATSLMTFVVTLSNPSDSAVSVSYSTASAAAMAGSDFVASSGTLVFAAGEVSKTISIPIISDLAAELAETFFLNLSNATGATIADSQGLGTILNDDVPTLSIAAISSDEGDSGTTEFTFTITLSQVAPFDVSVDFATMDGTAKAGLDFTARNGTLVIPEGSDSGEITVTVLGETLVESSESFSLVLSSPHNAGIASGTGTATILNDDDTTLKIASTFLLEGDAGTSDAVFTVSLSAPSASDVTFTFATRDGTAKAVGDYVATSGSLTIPAGSLSVDIVVPVVGDTRLSAAETFFVDVSNVSGALGGTLSATGEILNDDAAVTIAVADASARENSAIVFTLQLSGAFEDDVSVSYSTTGGTAVTDVDFQSVLGGVVFLAGETSKTASVSLIDDTLLDPDETFTFSAAVGSSGIQDSATGKIIDDEFAFDISGGTFAENGEYTFVVTRTGATDSEFLIDYQTRAGTATVGEDFVSKSGAITFAPGETEVRVSYALIDDTLIELTENFFVDLSPHTSGTTPNPIRTSTAQIDITNNDLPTVALLADGPLFAIEDGDADAGRIPFKIVLSEPSDFEITVRFSTLAGTAGDGDYSDFEDVVVFAPGQTEYQDELVIFGDHFAESLETFSLHISSPEGAVLGVDSLTLSILDNDGVVISKNKKSATWRDLDGDLVTLKVSKPVLSAELFTFRFGAAINDDLSGQLLESLDFSSVAAAAENAVVKFTAKRKDGLGDGFVNVGSILAPGTNLRAVSVAGDLGRIETGSLTAGKGLGALTVRSLGAFGVSTQGALGIVGGVVHGKLGKLKVAGDVRDATLRIVSSAVAVGSIGGISIGGVFAGSDGDGLFADGKIGSVVIRGDILGAGPASPIRITAAGLAGNQPAIASVTVGGRVANAEILAGYDSTDSAVNGAASIGSVKVAKTWTASSIAAGIQRGTDDRFGTDDDSRIGAGGSLIVSRIASILIAGEVGSSLPVSDHFGFVAGTIGRAKIAGALLPLTTSVDTIEMANANDATLKEIL